MLHLHQPTDEGWFDRIEPHLNTVLLDHAHLEKRAASAAMSMMFRYTDKPDLARALAEVVHEEIEHFTQMLDILADRGVAYENIEPASYAGRLMKKTARKDPDALLDKLLVSSLIEARSCERFKILSERIEAAELAEFYRELMVSEARHHTLYTGIARQLFPEDRVDQRLEELAQLEWDAIRQSTEAPRLHSF
jgi:tRNA-(ms[2]io[6]A)-hydroxylase